MIPGLSGSLLSHDALSDNALISIRGGAATANYRWFQSWHRQLSREMGPASSARQVYDRVAVPLATSLGLRVVPAAASPGTTSVHALLHTERAPAATIVVTEWGRDPASAWRDAVRTGIAHGVKWTACITGPVLRLFDATRTYSRRFAQFDLEITAEDLASLELLYALMSAEAFNGDETGLDRAVTISERHRAAVRTSLQSGVHDALTSLLRAFAAARRQLHPNAETLFEESLIVIYRILFLLFAEARGLVPKWHPIYRDSYTIESLRDSTERLASPPGLWESIQAIARLAHRGCRAGTLRVPPFNGRLFSPAHAPLAESLVLDDGAVRDAMLALTTRQEGTRRRRIAYSDLGVEQLGGVYERLLDFAPVRAGQHDDAPILQRADRRKATGSFYTPRPLTEFLVRRALAPLVHEVPAEGILALRIVDPAMGSGAFLVAACRYLAAAYEAALVRDGVVSALDVTEADRGGFRRLVTQRCLFGVDVNPMAVQLARLSLWLATLARDKPLTFLDHHLRVGNSLAGASIDDVLRHPSRKRRPATAREQLRLFDLDQLERDMQTIVVSRQSLALEPDDNIEQVRTKERVLAGLETRESPLTAWRRVANLWCAGWFLKEGQVRTSKAFGALVDEILGRGSVLPAHVSKPLFESIDASAEHHRFFHWQLEFPEVFRVGNAPVPMPFGFDAVIGNPPWEVLRGHPDLSGDTALTAFSRRSGAYRWQGEGHANLYQMFLERGLSLTRPGGRIALVLPSGFAVDHGCARLRAALMDRTSIDTFVTVENRDALFPIHRGLKFLLVTATNGQSTTTIPCRSGVRSASDFERIPDRGDREAIDVPRSVIERFSGDQLAIPEIRRGEDVAILARTVFRFAPLASTDGWGIRFGRELNATDDRKHFVSRCSRGCMPVIGGKQIQPFVAHIDRAAHYISQKTAARVLGSAAFTKPRLAYRDVASASNRLTVIAAIVPAFVITTHTLFCLKRDVTEDVQLFLCGILNSFVANYLARLRVSTHVSASIMERLPVPRPTLDSREFRDIVGLTRRIVSSPYESEPIATLHAQVARLYRLEIRDFQHVLDTFPLVPLSERQAALAAFSHL